jgi:hypothetical protein
VNARGIRKQVYHLTAEDFTRHPVWEFALDEEGKEGQDEATVRPLECDMADGSMGMLVVRAGFVLADGSTMPGFLTPPVPLALGPQTLQPTITAATGQVPFWCGVISPKPEDISRWYARLNRPSPNRIFPIRYASDFPIKGGPLNGEVSGFMVLEDWAKNRVRVIT